MTLAERIGSYSCVAVAGLAKNVGKTVTLNYLLRESHKANRKVGVTSIGIDGESVDQVTRTRKPEIRIYGGMLFATSETHYRSRLIEAEVLALSARSTSLGDVVTARALSDGKVLLSGPSDTVSLKREIEVMRQAGADTVLVDGAISRLSLASPAVTDAMVLATGAALAPGIPDIVAKTAFTCRLAALPEVEKDLQSRLEPLLSDVWAVDGEMRPRPLGLKSTLDLEGVKDKIFKYGDVIYTPGIVTDRFLRFLASRKEAVTLIARDFTRLFVEPVTLGAFLGKGGELKVLRKSRLLAVTYNPVNPSGYSVDGVRLGDALRERIDVPVVYIDPEDS